MTKRFYHESLDMIRFREELTARYQRDFMNHNDTKIGKDYFVMEPLKRPVSRATTTVPRVASPGRPGARASRSRTPSCRGSSSNTRVPAGAGVVQAADDHRDQGVFSDIVARVHGFDFVFGLGGIHGSVESEIIESDEGSVIVDLDVTSYYPTLAIANGFDPRTSARRLWTSTSTCSRSARSTQPPRERDAQARAQRGLWGQQQRVQVCFTTRCSPCQSRRSTGNCCCACWPRT